MSYIGNQPYQVAFLTDTFNGDGTTTAFLMSVAPANPASVLVVISGVVQDPLSYAVSGTTLTFSAAPPSGTATISVRYLGIPASGVTTTAYRTVTEFTATAGQTTFTPPSYTVGFITVFRNGVRLGSADYTATNGTTVVLGSGATVGDLVTIESYYVSSYLNAIPATANAVADMYISSVGSNKITGVTNGVNATAGYIGEYASISKLYVISVPLSNKVSVGWNATLPMISPAADNDKLGGNVPLVFLYLNETSDCATTLKVLVESLKIVPKLPGVTQTIVLVIVLYTIKL